jgi:signal transduction histidine kinase
VENPSASSSAFDGDEHERLVAARELRLHPRKDALADLKAALARERVRWVQTALKEAVEQCEALGESSGGVIRAPREPDETADSRQAYADGRRDGLRQALHEMSPLVGLARAAAEGELEAGSEVGRQLNRMRAVTGALRQLVTASEVPHFRDFDLADALTTLANSPAVPCPDGVVGTRGPSPFPLSGDQDLLELAVQPLLANAIEAVMSVEDPPANRSVMVAWGSDHDRYWIAVIDEGPGPPKGGDLFAAGASDKDGHFGFGLATVRTAITSLEGTVELEQNGRGGATAILRWPRLT